MSGSSASREAGLDTLRAAAIALVFVFHYQAFVPGAAPLGWLADLGWIGVDLFFVLSGYLVTRQLLRGPADEAGRQDLSLLGFWGRRFRLDWRASLLRLGGLMLGGLMLLCIVGYSGMAWAFALALVWALCPGSLPQRLRSRWVGWLAATSYSMYLIHKPVFHAVGTLLVEQGPALQALGVLLACLGVCSLLHYGLERPLMRQRDRWLPPMFVRRTRPDLTRAAPAAGR